MVSEEKIKEAFSKIKEEMEELREEIASLKNDFRVLSAQILSQKKPFFSEEVPKKAPKNLGTYFGTSTESSALKQPKTEELSPKNQFSIGNEGVSALRQQIGNTFGTSKMLEENVERLKRALKDTFRQLTKQEFKIFALLYQAEEELKRPISYGDLATRASLTPNSLRDYISKLIAKGVPIVKEKLNNRQILLKVAPELRNLETLESLMKLVES